MPENEDPKLTGFDVKLVAQLYLIGVLSLMIFGLMSIGFTFNLSVWGI